MIKRFAAPVFVLAGAIAALFGSFQGWGICPDSACGRGGLALQVVWYPTGIEVGVGIFSALLAVGLFVTGVITMTQPSHVRQWLSGLVVLMGLAVVLAVAVFTVATIATHPGMSAPYFGAMIAAAGGLVGAVGGVLMARRRRPKVGVHDFRGL